MAIYSKKQKKKANIDKKNNISLFLKNKGIKKIYYFHTDHFEPTSLDHNWIINQDIIEEFADQMNLYEHSKRMTLFYRPTFRVAMKKDVSPDEKYYKIKGDKVVFIEDEKTIKSKKILKFLNKNTSHEFQMHIHHEHFTDSDEVSDNIKYYIKNDSTSMLDEKRFDEYIKISREFMREGSDASFQKWFFIHGKWGLNGSDRRVCRIEDELRILSSYGCYGDFTFPSGRRHCNPHVKAPFVTKPVRTLKCYDYYSSESNKVFLNSNAMKDNEAHMIRRFGRRPFFIWNSRLIHPLSSFDYYSGEILDNLSFHNSFLNTLLRKSVKIGDMLFVKTYAHSLAEEVISADKIVFPLAHPKIVKIFKLLESICLKNEIKLNYVTASEVYNIFKGIDDGTIKQN